MPEPAISLVGLTKYYGHELGVADITFEVFPGETVGFLGPNGAGKTTSMRSLVGLLNITSGSARIFGEKVSVRSFEMRSRIGYLPGAPTFYQNLTAKEHLSFLAKMRNARCANEIDSLAERLELDLSRRVHDLSKGNQQKVGVIQALMHRPDVLILDEPTSGLDPIVQREFAVIIDECKSRGAAILLSSHVLSEVEHLADRVVILNLGKQILVDDIRHLKEKAVRTVDLFFHDLVDDKEFVGISGVSEVFGYGTRITCKIVGSENALFAKAVQMGLESVQSHESGLDEIFFSIVDGGESSDNAVTA
jgi:ABC-2 type transport system ATP-binding protein